MFGLSDCSTPNLWAAPNRAIIHISLSVIKLPASKLNCQANCRVLKSVNQVAALLSVGCAKVYALMREGKLQYEKREVGRRVMHYWIDEYMMAVEDESYNF
jgi:hypothetical protein